MCVTFLLPLGIKGLKSLWCCLERSSKYLVLLFTIFSSIFPNCSIDLFVSLPSKELIISDSPNRSALYFKYLLTNKHFWEENNLNYHKHFKHYEYKTNIIKFPATHLLCKLICSANKLTGFYILGTGNIDYLKAIIHCNSLQGCLR